MEAKLAQSTGFLPGPVHERAALLRARSGDRDAFRVLLAQHQARVYGIALRLTGLPDEAAHLALEVFIELHSALPRIASPGHLTRWLLRETTRRVLHQVRQQAADGNVMPMQDLADLPPRRLLLQLPPDARAVVLLGFQEGLEPDEIAAVLDLGKSVVEHSLARSLDWMATQGAGDEHELEGLLRTSLVAPDPGPEFTERVLAHVELRRSHRPHAAFAPSGAGRKRGRFILIGATLIVALGATWLALRLSDPAVPPVAAPPVAGELVPEPAGEAAASQPQIPPAEVVAPGTGAGQLPSRDVYPHYVVIASPLRQQSGDPSAWAAVESFHAALLDELGKVQGVTLLVPGLTAPPADHDRSADYLLSVTGLETAVLASGSEGFRVTDGPRIKGPSIATEPASGVVVLPAGGGEPVRRWPVEIRIQSIGQPQSRGYTSVVQVGAEPAQLAALQIEALRVRFFPDVLARQRLAAIIRDDSLPPIQRNRALSELLGALARARGTGFESSTVSTIVQYAAVLPADQRAAVWRSLRGLVHPELASGLIESARHDPDEEVRFEALATLAADYPSDPAAHTAFGSVATEDSEEVMRMAARRALQGEAEWRAFVLARLGDARVSPEERLEPLVLLARSATTQAELASLQALVRDPETTRGLMKLVSDGWFDPLQVDSTADALDLLARADNTAAYDLLVQMPRRVAPPAVTPTGPAPPSGPEPETSRPRVVVSAENMVWLQDHQDSPRARRLLQDIESGRADPRVNATIEQMRRQQQRGFPPRLPQR